MSPVLPPVAGACRTRSALSTQRRFTLFVLWGICVGASPLEYSDAQQTTTLRLRDVTQQSGIRFRHTIGDDKMTNIVEASGVGCAVLDFDQDGWMDLYLVNGVHLDELNDPAVADRQSLRNATDRLFRNRGDGTFEDVTEAAGILPGGYGMGVTVGDYDNDGWPDLYVTNYGPNRLYRNLGNGRFEEVAEKAGVECDLFGVGCAFVDFDNDGHLDLYVGNYLYYTPDFDRPTGFPGPTAYRGQVNRLFRNNGQGGFVDVTDASGMADYAGHTMGVGVIDFNEDGKWDLFVANDAMENYFFQNLGDGRFEENGLLTNVAYGDNGEARGAMGAEVGDVDGDGVFDIFVPDFTYTCLYMNLGDGFFEDQARRAGLAIACSRYISWGAALVDLDRDPELDIYVANGDANSLLAHPDQVFLNDGKGFFTDVTKEAGVAAMKPQVSRGVVAADFDNDGDLDLLVVHLNDHPVLLRNETPREGRHWLMLDLVGRTPQSNRDAIGAVARCKIPGPDATTRLVPRRRSSSGSYLSAHDPRLHFGLGNVAVVPELEIRWPNGAIQTLRDVPADQILRVEQPAD